MNLRDTASVVATLCTALVAGVLVGVNPLAAVGLAVSATLFVATFIWPQTGISAWVIMTAFTPYWTEATVGGLALNPYLLSVLFLVPLLLTRRCTIGRFTWLDGAVVAGSGVVLYFHHIYGQERFLWTNVVFALAGSYFLGRYAGDGVKKVYAFVMVIVAIWGIIEYESAWHAFVNWQASQGGIGPQIQERAGGARSEATLGHAIAFGASLVIALPFANRLRWPLVAQTLLCLGVFVSVSRGPILAIGLTFVLIIWSRTSASSRLRSLLFLVAGSSVAYYVFSYIYSSAGQGEVQSSSEQRSSQLSAVLHATNVWGPADGYQFAASLGSYAVNGVSIIDNAALRLATDFGWIPTVMLLAPMAIAIYAVIRREAGPASIALVSQIPVVLATSFITQWQQFYFFLAGMAVSEFFAGRRQSIEHTPNSLGAESNVCLDSPVATPRRVPSRGFASL